MMPALRLALGRGVVASSTGATRITRSLRRMHASQRLPPRLNASNGLNGHRDELANRMQQRDKDPYWEGNGGVVDRVENGASEDDWLYTIQELLAEKGIYLKKYKPGTQRILCPKCGGGSQDEISLSVTIDEAAQCALFHCFRATCEWTGVVRAAVNDGSLLVMPPPRDPLAKKPVTDHLIDLDDECYEFFRNRGISRERVDRNGIRMELKSDRKFLAFPYKVNGEIVNIKYRALDRKEFHQVAGAAKVMYGLDDIKDAEDTEDQHKAAEDEVTKATEDTKCEATEDTVDTKATKGEATEATKGEAIKDKDDPKKRLIIVEGEMDKLAMEQAGLINVLSVPDGAPGKVKDGPPSPEDRKYSYLNYSRELFEKKKAIILATDNDASGDALAEELARRVGYAKCYRVKWPKSFEDTILREEEQDTEFTDEERKDVQRWMRKDANEILMKDSEAVLRAYVNNMQPFPVAGLYQFIDFFDEIKNHYLLESMCPSGYTTGWHGLDELYRVVPGELTIVSGVPNSGKSEWLDALAVNMAELHGWRVAFASMEKHAWDHGRMLIEKHVRKPFFQNVHYAKGADKMNPEEMRQGVEWINDRFPLIIRTDETLTTVDWILEKAQLAVNRFGIYGLVIDPYNELDHDRSPRMSETEFVSKMLTQLKRFAQSNKVHVWFVAHPRQMPVWTGKPPNLYDISGSAHFMNKADAGIIIHRNWEKINKDKRDSATGKLFGKEDEEEEFKEEDKYLVRIIIRKMRNKAAGTTGEHMLKYNPADGTYYELPPEEEERIKAAQESKGAAGGHY